MLHPFTRLSDRLNPSHGFFWLALVTFVLQATLWASQALAQGFAAYISPPRFELNVKAGQTLRQVIDIQHVGTESGNFRVYTNDWTYRADNTVAFSDALAADSCRPWVALERRELTISPASRYRFRFEISPPADTPARECRFAIMIEGLDPARVTQDNLNFPVSGRIAVIVYAVVGDAAPQLEILKSRVAQANAQQLPVLEVRNVGNAHGRMDGFLTGKDASGLEFEMAPADSPILPGETRLIAISPVVGEGKTPPVIQYPLTVKGTLEWGTQRIPLEQRFAP